MDRQTDRPYIDLACASSVSIASLANIVHTQSVFLCAFLSLTADLLYATFPGFNHNIRTCGQMILYTNPSSACKAPISDDLHLLRAHKLG